MANRGTECWGRITKIISEKKWVNDVYNNNGKKGQ